LGGDFLLLRIVQKCYVSAEIGLQIIFSSPLFPFQHFLDTHFRNRNIYLENQ
jgi:hypothetical protein